MWFDTRCAACGDRGPALCERCVQALRGAPPVDPPPGLDRVDALLAHEGAGRAVVIALKYRNDRAALGALGRALGTIVAPAAVDVVTWAPTTGSRRRARGYDQAELLARAVARSVGRPCRRLLDRCPGPPQTGNDRRRRLEGPRLVAVRRAPPGVLLVDDVLTTGATLAAGARALRTAGATTVHGATLTVTFGPFAAGALKAATAPTDHGQEGGDGGTTPHRRGTDRYATD